jgi:hypothetical protein
MAVCGDKQQISPEIESVEEQVGAAAPRLATTQERSNANPVALMAALLPWLASLPVSAEELLPGAPPASSYYVSLGLFVVTLPGEI